MQWKEHKIKLLLLQVTTFQKLSFSGILILLKRPLSLSITAIVHMLQMSVLQKISMVKIIWLVLEAVIKQFFVGSTTKTVRVLNQKLKLQLILTSNHLSSRGLALNQKYLLGTLTRATFLFNKKTWTRKRTKCQKFVPEFKESNQFSISKKTMTITNKLLRFVLGLSDQHLLLLVYHNS